MGTALITGATSGIGREFCWQLSNAGHNLVIVARDRDRLEELADNVRRVNRVTVEVFDADLAEPAELAAVCRRLSVNGSDEDGGFDGELAPVDILVNNAGFGFGTSFLKDDFENQLYGLDVMVRAVMATCYYAGRQMQERGSGTIINISSVAADTGMGPYSAHKGWVRAFSEGLHEELQGSGVKVVCSMPGLTHTDFHRRSQGGGFGNPPEMMWMNPNQVVKETLEAAQRNQALVTPSLRYKVIYHAQRIAPRSVVRAVVNRLPHS
ncbi:SDR family NAD(P)-dependent oxidoreductase [Actinomyces minihominis]|uniref:SDR family NAD(P)-dependent oxidoreductase n=1 Tax=Actinomyces minihominis TaxID=2002838 RepID=UPI000C085786|nr:SDR family oxidoreductase [Actinomyces minihominis]